MNSPFTGESCFRGRCFSENNRCQSRKNHPVLCFNPSPRPGLKVYCALEMQTHPMPQPSSTAPRLHPPHRRDIPLALPPRKRPHPTVRCVLGCPCRHAGLAFATARSKPPRAWEAFVPALLPAIAQREGAGKTRLAGPFIPAVLLIGALGTKIWLPVPRGRGKGFGTHRHPAPNLGSGAPVAPGLGEKGSKAGSPAQFRP